jgi:hypothetical protein
VWKERGQFPEAAEEEAVDGWWCERAWAPQHGGDARDPVSARDAERSGGATLNSPAANDTNGHGEPSTRLKRQARTLLFAFLDRRRRCS